MKKLGVCSVLGSNIQHMLVYAKMTSSWVAKFFSIGKVHVSRYSPK